VFFQAASIEQKLKRICDAFGAKQFDVPDLEHTAEIKVRGNTLPVRVVFSL
jgi:hypothetical protein